MSEIRQANNDLSFAVVGFFRLSRSFLDSISPEKGLWLRVDI